MGTVSHWQKNRLTQNIFIHNDNGSIAQEGISLKEFQVFEEQCILSTQYELTDKELVTDGQVQALPFH